ncbi:MAG: hypothetical protein AAGK78_00135 [Planctomycetota bacterium]
MISLSDLTNLHCPILAMGDGPFVWVCVGIAIWLLSAAMSKEGGCGGKREKTRRDATRRNTPDESRDALAKAAGFHRRCRSCNVAHPSVAKFCRECGDRL